MKKLYVIKIGTTFSSIKKRFGDYGRWTADAIGNVDVDLEIVDVEHGAALPEADACAGIVITGSHAMVTDNEPWSVKLEEWIKRLLDLQVPIFGICYGHQLLARAAGGRVGYHPAGREIGTVSVEMLAHCADDPIFKGLAHSFLAHVAHSQTVLNLPESAIHLASNPFDPHHAFRLGECAWGVQFHPEYDIQIMRAYIEELAKDLEGEGMDVPLLFSSISETPVAAEIIRRFGNVVVDRLDRV